MALIFGKMVRSQANIWEGALEARRNVRYYPVRGQVSLMCLRHTETCVAGAQENVQMWKPEAGDLKGVWSLASNCRPVSSSSWSSGNSLTLCGLLPYL